MNAQTRLSADGHVKIPRDVRERLRWSAGMMFGVIEREGSVTLRPLPAGRSFAPTTLADLASLPRFDGARRATDEISGLDDAALTRLLDADERRD